MKEYSIKVKPFSKDEDTVMNLMGTYNTPPGSVRCRLGSLCGKSYNEYIVNEDFYKEYHNTITAVLRK